MVLCHTGQYLAARSQGAAWFERNRTEAGKWQEHCREHIGSCLECKTVGSGGKD